MKIYLVHAEHFQVPGIILKAFATRQAATAEAVDLTNIMLKDSGYQPLATPCNLEHHLARLEDEHGAAHCFVEIIEQDVLG